MKKELKRRFLFVLASIVIVLFFAEPLQIGLRSVSAQTYPTLRIRVRYADGTAAEGVKVELYREDMGLPDIYERDCIVSRGGFCEFTLRADWSYIIKFPGNEQTDPITAAAAGHSGVDGVGIVLRNDYTMGFVLSKLLEEETEANWMLLDLTPEEQTPLPRIPEGAVEMARIILQGDQPNEPVQDYPTVTPIPVSTVEQIQIAVPTIPMLEEPTEVPQEISEIELIELTDPTSDENSGEVETVSDGGLPDEARSSWLIPALIIILALLLFIGWVILSLLKHQEGKSAK